MDLLGLIMAVLPLSIGVTVLPLMIVYRSRIPKLAWVISIEAAINGIVVGVLQWLHLYGVDTTVARALAAGIFSFAIIATPALFLVKESRRSMHG